MATQQKLILYSYCFSSCAWRVRNALAYKGIDYETRTINLLENEQTNEEFKKLNPMSQVPALIVNGRIITQSISIMEYLEEMYPEKPLLPKCSYDRAKVREISELIVSGIQPLQNISVAAMQKAMSEYDWSQFFNKKGLQAIERIVQETSGKFCVKDDVSFADCCLVPQVFSASVRFGIDLKEFPAILRINKTLESLDSFKTAHPLEQPDSPSKL